MFVTIIVGAVTSDGLDLMAATSPSYEEAACTSHYGVLIERRHVRASSDTPFIQLVLHYFGAASFGMDFLLVCSKFLFNPAFYGEESEEGNDAPIDKDRSPWSVDAPGERTGTDKNGFSGAGGGENDVPVEHKIPRWLAYMHDWRVYPLSRVLTTEICYHIIDLGYAADPDLGSLSHWVIWGITFAYLAAETGIKLIGAPKNHPENSVV